MPCDLEIIREVPLFALLDDEELAVLAEQVEIAQFAPRQRIYRINDPARKVDQYLYDEGWRAVAEQDQAEP